MTRKNQNEPQQAIPPEEFDAVVAMLQNDAELRGDIEFITGQSLEGKTPRELYLAFRAVNTMADIQLAVAKYGKARQLLRQTRADVARGELEGVDVSELTTNEVVKRRLAELENKVDILKVENAKLKDSNKALHSGNVAPINGRAIKGELTA